MLNNLCFCLQRNNLSLERSKKRLAVTHDKKGLKNVTER
jgi:hypothetical protein